MRGETGLKASESLGPTNERTGSDHVRGVGHDCGDRSLILQEVGPQLLGQGWLLALSSSVSSYEYL